MDNLYLLMPAYNEEANIESVIREWYDTVRQQGSDSRFVINCSGSTDGTLGVIRMLQMEFPMLETLTDSENTYGAKVSDLYDYAVDAHADFVFQTDSDGQTDPSEFPAFWTLRNTYDAVIGCRRERGDGKSRLYVEKVVCLMLRLFFGVSVPDANAPFRLIRGELLEKYMAEIPRSYSMPNIMMTTFLSYYRENIVFKEIHFQPRRGGKNTMNMKHIFDIGLESIVTFWKVRKESKP